MINVLQRRGRKKWIWILPLAAILIGSLVAWRLSNGRSKRDPVWERIQDTGTLRVCTDASFPPFEFIQDGQFVGYDIDLAWELAYRLGLSEVRPVNIHFDGLYDALADGKCDTIISALPFDPTRTEDVGYSVPYFHAGQVLVTWIEATDIGGPEDLAGRRVAVELGSEAHYVARQWTVERGVSWDVVTTYTAAEALESLRAREADAAIVDAVTAYAALGSAESAPPRLELVGEQLTDEPYVIAVPLNADVLLDEINRALADMATEGSPTFKAQLRAKWF